MSTLDVNIINPVSGTTVTVNNIGMRSPIATTLSIGNNAMTSSVAGDNSVVIGEKSLQNAIGISKSVLVGSGTMRNSLSGTTFSVAIGYDAMRSANQANGSVAIGYQSLYNTSSNIGGNVAIGKDTLLFSTTGSFNTAIGTEAGKSVTTGFGNILIGQLAAPALTTGSSNIFIGQNSASFNSGDLFTGSNNIAIGGGSNPSTLNVNNEITLGNSSNTVIRAAVTTITSLSDERDKKEIKPLQVGTDFVKTLKPVEFIWDERDENGKHNIKDFGFIAQDLKRAQEDINLQDTLKLVYEENPDKLEASYGKLVPILVKAIQELTERLELIEKKQ